ncbi:hypothetical protein SISSUDRAFT_790410 [Sistotremastrum suecicum HHB10207 ss-3]|uniref:Uncharacterized protein n=1 Tax=Sistotremastrum suecicum HHB10207 ss-3 TaxID=1314776 RepID=A0A166CZ97_9AGAM|nr:hypothetical protein SISSUDRAFT_790410 [Sistotremastrum suecicum HHB10207 ss-3]
MHGRSAPSAPRSTHQLPQRPQQEFMAATPRKSSSSTPRYSLNSSSSMMPPSAPLSARLKASGSESTHSMRTNQSSNALSSNANMGPPRQFPPPGYVSSAPILINSNSESSSSNIGTSSGSGGHQRFIPPTPNGSSSSGSRRFIPLTPRISGASAGGGGGTRRFIPANTGDGTNGGGSMRPSTHTGFR